MWSITVPWASIKARPFPLLSLQDHLVRDDRLFESARAPITLTALTRSIRIDNVPNRTIGVWAKVLYLKSARCHPHRFPPGIRRRLSSSRPSKFLKRKAPFAHIARAGTLISGCIEVATLRSSLPASCRPNPHHITPQRNMQSLFLSLPPVQTWAASVAFPAPPTGSKTWAKPLQTRNGLLSFSSSFAGRRPWMTVVNAIVPNDRCENRG